VLKVTQGHTYFIHDNKSFFSKDPSARMTKWRIKRFFTNFWSYAQKSKERDHFTSKHLKLVKKSENHFALDYLIMLCQSVIWSYNIFFTYIFINRQLRDHLEQWLVAVITLMFTSPSSNNNLRALFPNFSGMVGIMVGESVQPWIRWFLAARDNIRLPRWWIIDRVPLN